MPNDTGVGALAEKKSQRRDNHRLSRTRLAGHSREAGRECEGRGLDHAEVLDRNLVNHEDLPRHPSVGSENFWTSRSEKGPEWVCARRTGVSD